MPQVPRPQAGVVAERSPGRAAAVGFTPQGAAGVEAEQRVVPDRPVGPPQGPAQRIPPQAPPSPGDIIAGLRANIDLAADARASQIQGQADQAKVMIAAQAQQAKDVAEQIVLQQARAGSNVPSGPSAIGPDAA